MKKFFYSFIILVLVLGGILNAATISVTSTADTNTSGTLRYAIETANNGDTIDLSSLGGQIITFGTEIAISKDLTIEGNVTNGIILNGDNSTRLFNINNSSVTFANIVFQNGGGTSDGGAIYVSNSASGEDINITNSHFKDNNSTTNGGAIVFQGSGYNVNITNSSFLNNYAATKGGVFGGWPDITINIKNSTFTNNSCGNYSGVIHLEGGVIYNIDSSTFVDNVATSGTTFYNQSGTLNIKNSVIYNSDATKEIFTNTVTTQGYNFISDTTLTASSGDIFYTDGTSPFLATLIKDSDGITWAYPLTTGSPLIDNGSCATIDGNITTIDQFGTSRPQGAGPTCDIGAIEYISQPKLTLKAHGAALQFDGTNYIGTITPVITNVDNITLETWFNWNGSTDNMALISNGTVDPNGYGINLNGATGQVWLWIGGQGSPAITEVLTPNQWYHVAFTRTNGTWKAYLNGVEATTNGVGLTSTPNTPSGITSIGGFPTGSRFKGMMDEVRIWDVARNNTEIKDNYTHQLDGNETGLVAYYNFDERSGSTVKDITSNGNYGTLEGNVTRLNFLGDSLEFDGIDDKITRDTIDLSGNSLTISTWINTKKDINATAGVSNIVRNSYINFFLRLENDVLQFTYDANGDEIDIRDFRTTITSEEFLNQWKHISVTFDNNSTNTILKLYIDGELRNTELFPAENLYYNTTQPFEIGGTSGDFFKGNIAEVSIFQKVLTIDEIKTNMNSSLKGDETGLVGYWPLNEGAGTLAKDYATNGNDGTISDATWIDTAPTIYGDTIYTTPNILSSHKLYVENNRTIPTYSYNGNLPSTILEFDGNNGSFLYTSSTDANESLDINATENGISLNTIFKVISYNSETTLTLNLTDVNLSEHNITNIQVVGVDGNSENLNIPEISSGNIYDGNNSYTVPIYNVDQNFSIKVDLDDNSTWWVNFNDLKLYSQSDEGSDFITTLGGKTNIVNLNLLSSNYILSLLAPSITHIYDYYRTPNFSNFTIPFEVNGTVGDDINITISKTNNIVNIIAPVSVTANITATLDISKIDASTIGNTEVLLTASNSSGLSNTKYFRIEISNRYDIISTKENTSISGISFSGDLYVLNSYIDENSSQVVQYEKIEFIESAHDLFREVKNKDGIVEVSEKEEDMPETFQIQEANISNIDLTILYTDNGMPFTFNDTNSKGKKIYVTYPTQKFDSNDSVYETNSTSISSLVDFMFHKTANETTYGIIRNQTRDKLLVFDSSEINNTSGTLIEIAEDGVETNAQGSWSKVTIDSREVLLLDTSSLSGYRSDAAFIFDTTDNKVKYVDYKAAGDIYSYILLNKSAKDELYNFLSPNPKIAVPVVNGYTYVSLLNDKTLCSNSLQSIHITLCDQNNTLESVFGTTTLLKYQEDWNYWDSASSINPLYRMNKFSTISPLDGVLVKATEAKTLYIPYDDDVNRYNNYEGMISEKWYLLSNNKDQTITEIVESATGKSIEYILVLRDDVWNIYAPLNDSSIDPAIPRITEIKRGESYWIIFSEVNRTIN